ncbi:SUF system NifU family Fe-S cluster assembly protein [Tessaracoccus sp. MC1865]|uniref:Fe-S cluster assembly sulfur transfer protein SufU n=1 Tax=unclassified Tessaracoccus TaxID=2635419 RepID=UPI0015FFBDB0|nr:MULTISPECIES: SUF system NifU family Fe-S cluster assembly protein [unclassified Tessaracoccus]MBB1483541.1 SUF system NifU family Fe-S cluster assembly protein [Tessaracoccus sp. MC1865]MBB1508964.1 SUF system NifU family Fe-S cluster assembly protein [Tessaracoccus sp. MC1756]QTO36631.1 SUF system NifU family Fe-S cluster assembly protein [Tessaracoccus sp. MC1865]
MNIDELYQTIILDHYREKHHAGLREPFQAEVHHVNPSCGDELTLRVQIDDGKVTDISYDAEGCSISQASVSIMTDLLIGTPVEHAMEMHDQFLAVMHSQGAIVPDEDVFEDAIAFAGVSKFPARVKCALLGWSAMRDAALQATA